MELTLNHVTNQVDVQGSLITIVALVAGNLANQRCHSTTLFCRTEWNLAALWIQIGSIVVVGPHHIQVPLSYQLLGWLVSRHIELDLFQILKEFFERTQKSNGLSYLGDGLSLSTL